MIYIIIKIDVMDYNGIIGREYQYFWADLLLHIIVSYTHKCILYSHANVPIRLNPAWNIPQKSSEKSHVDDVNLVDTGTGNPWAITKTNEQILLKELL